MDLDSRQELFFRRFEQLWDLIASEQPQLGYSGPVSFRNEKGFIYHTEGYKERDAKVNGERLREADHSDPISLNHAVSFCIVNSSNLLKPANRDWAVNQIAQKPLQAWKAIIGVFSCTEGTEKEAFENAAVFFGAKYDIVSYLFYLKDRERFFSIRSDTYGQRLACLGFPGSCTAKCTWENYSTFLSCLNEIKQRLIDALPASENITLTDAESFMWMMYKLFQNGKMSKSDNDPPENELETVVRGGREGSRHSYFTTRYERDPALRRAVAQRDDYRCQACGIKFEEMYGAIGRGFIEVHHMLPLSSRDEDRITDPSELVAVCSNCHRMIHRKKNAVYSVEEIRTLIKQNKSKTRL